MALACANASSGLRLKLDLRSLLFLTSLDKDQMLKVGEYILYRRTVSCHRVSIQNELFPYDYYV